MRILIEKTTNADGLPVQEMSIDDHQALTVHPIDDVPIEQMVSCEDVVQYMRRAFQAAKRGETLEVVVMTVDY